jgi:uncharacterized protein
MNEEKSIVWRRLDVPGHEYARISSNQSGVQINGTAILVFGSAFCKLDYAIKCRADWRTEAVKVSGFVGEKIIDIDIAVDEKNIWKLNGDEVSEVRDCLDIDLNFSPLTNTLPIRRLKLAVGKKSTVRAAWLRFPGFQLESLEQSYERTSETIYHYESAGGRFTTDIEVDYSGLAVKYPNFWQIENGKS